MNTDLLKIIGILTMTIDHVGLLFFPEQIELRIIGRIALPIFAFLIALGVDRTSNLRAYQKRLGLFALISQLPYMWAFQTTELNIMFTLLIATFLIELLRERDLKNYLLVAGLLLIIAVVPVSYGVYGVLFPSVFYFFKGKPINLALSFLLLHVLTQLDAPIQWFSALGIVLCYVRINKGIRLNRWVFYAYYPAHLLLLASTEFFLNN